ncbi:MAG TPA: hypothetical protein VEV17_12210 [Bryobacteraceae bacterium]|nr:hypothetical protein [Bryobacteraceae bacterium]
MATTGDKGPALSAAIGGPFDVAYDSIRGDLYVSTGSQFLVRKIDTSGTITTVAGGGGPFGSGVSGSLIGDGGKATSGTLDDPLAIAVDQAGNLYISDHLHQRVRRVDTSGTITTFAGTGVPGYSGDNGPATNAQLFNPRQIATDNQGNVYVADSGNFCIRKITPDGTITTVVGTGVSGAGGDGGPAVNAQLNAALSVAVDSLGNLYTANTARIRRVDAVTGIISTIAGNGSLGFQGDGGPATTGEVNVPWSLAVDSAFNVYFVDQGNLRVRELSPQWITAGGVLNAASLQAGAVSPGEIVAINITGFDPTQTGGQILFDGNQATVVSSTSNQVTVIVPYEVDGQASTQLQIVAGVITTNTVTVPVATTAPGIYTKDSSGQGAGMILNADSSVNSSQNPASRGTNITISATGEGQTTPPGVDGQVAGATPPVPNQMVSVQIGGVDAPIVSAGGTPGQPAGYFQVVVQVPDDAPVGDVPIVLTVGGGSSEPGVIVSIQ